MPLVKLPPPSPTITNDRIRRGNDRHIGIVGIAEFAVVEAVATTAAVSDEVEAVRRPESLVFNLPSQLFLRSKKRKGGAGGGLFFSHEFF